MKSRLDELAVLVEHMLSSNTVSIRKLRSFAGKCQSMAGVLYHRRPLVHMLYGALHSTPSP